MEPGIIEIIFTGHETIDVEDIKELRRVNLKLTEEKPYTVLVEAEQLATFTREVRELLASKEFMGRTYAKALVFDGLAQRLMGNFYLHVNKPHIKTRLFNDRNKAIEWLREQVIEMPKE
jgi:hypothetical protein